MTTPTSTTEPRWELLGVPAGVDTRAVLAQMLRRAGSPGLDRWWMQAEYSGFCASPIHLTGTDRFGRQHQVVTRCNNRRHVVCPSCSDLYARDTGQLVHAGLHGGYHNMPESVAGHSQVFLTLTAPSYGAVHTASYSRNNTAGKGARCHDSHRRGLRRSPHGQPQWCNLIHDRDDPRIGQPLCGRCYDYTGHVLFGWHTPELWRRFTIRLRRLLNTRLRAIGEPADSVRINYIKVDQVSVLDRGCRRAR